ncbi:hypothetical protein OnM2_000036 [Erysiphe neolycopersici]|uniref:Uncharacterized protein n=1 Tax=Erysiphe neolycopersici TaxID=212602 RepID=A0A420I8F0_9PEZI|nr:hypothetical protein OnM2_000036 [Erysiphe neolycopersici]
MRISFFSIILNLLLTFSVVSCGRISYNKLLRPTLPYKLIGTKLDFKCHGKLYYSEDLDKAAKEACSDYLTKLSLLNQWSSWLWLRPFFTKLPMYNGKNYEEHKSKGKLLEWPLQLKSPSSGMLYHPLTYLLFLGKLLKL